MQTMSSRERVMTSLSWKEPDRVPLQIYLTPEISAALQDYFRKRRNYFGSESIPEILGIDFRSVGPAHKAKEKIKPPRDGIVYDAWGIGYKTVHHGSAGAYMEAWELPWAQMTTLEEVERYPWPSADDYDYSTIEQQCDKHKDFAVMTGGAGIPDIVNGTLRGRGMEQVLLDIVTRDPVGLAIIDKRVEYLHEMIRRTLEAGKGKIDILCLGEDLGNQNGMMVSWRDFNEVFRPRIQRFIDLAHAHGARAMLHCCGDSHEVQPALIEMGLDILDAMQPEPKGMDPEKIRAACKGKLAFCGLISTQDTLPFRGIEDCRREARHRLDVIAKGGGYIFSPAHCIQAATPLENILAVYEEALGKKLIVAPDES